MSSVVIWVSAGRRSIEAYPLVRTVITGQRIHTAGCVVVVVVVVVGSCWTTDVNLTLTVQY